MQSDYLIGLDLGQACDHSAVAILERTWKAHPRYPDRPASHYAVRHLWRWPLQTSYTVVATDLTSVVRLPLLNWPVVVIDQTGVGRAVVDYLGKTSLSASLKPVVITGGKETSRANNGAWHVPKKELVSCLQALLRSQRLQPPAASAITTILSWLSRWRPGGESELLPFHVAKRVRRVLTARNVGKGFGSRPP
jgi:hypothetical protein